jgi:FKBP-type peptidyl-prolyl cis-trans isomerase FkpA
MGEDGCVPPCKPHRNDAGMSDWLLGPAVARHFPSLSRQSRLDATARWFLCHRSIRMRYGLDLADGGTPMTNRLAVFLAVTLAACGNATGPEVCSVIEECTFASELGIDLSQMTKTASGLYWQDLEAGTGSSVSTGTFVLFHSIGWLADGTVIGDTHEIDPTCTCAPALADTVGVGHLIPGWDEGFIGAQLGTVRLLVIPPDLAYGATGYEETVPPNAVIVSKIEILSVTQPE